MDEKALRRLLGRLTAGEVSLDEAVAKLRHAPFERLGDVATIDTHRALRLGLPEVVLAEAKTAAQVAAIA
ncbi:MAG TPA: 1-(5-phosphoribosyl)-5-amino-4-imidazole-carboxylate carboxylase, partial [Anaeromyxobacteraceae bacterium]|nr:1-(5-phosphoribosyl)-5-amino-4-imidazole-carboxylate carboxylase [Anaeromyxobacteraceae bacterium]